MKKLRTTDPVGSSIPACLRCLIFIEDDILDPMQLIFDAPMSPNDVVKLLCIGDDTTDVKLLLVERFAVPIAVSVHHDAALYSDPLVPKGCNRIKDAHPPVGAASMTLLVFLIPAERLICLGLLLNSSIQSLLIRFDTH